MFAGPRGYTGAAAGILLVLCGCGGAVQGEKPAVGAGSATASEADVAGRLWLSVPAESPGASLENLLQVTERIYSGSEPAEEEAFAQLARLGVRTVVSVDGARPDLEAARRHGLRYVHIPIGYDGISPEAGQSLARLVRDAAGPFYIHCHHGRHRGPAAAAIASIAYGAVDGQAAQAILEKAGTSRGYGGLWRDVAAYRAPLEGAALPPLVEVAEVGSLAVAMALIDRAFEHLQRCQAAQWQPPADHPDVVPAQEALLLKEGFRETVRQLAERTDYDERFLLWMKESEKSAAELQQALEQGEAAAAATEFRAVQEHCQRCHLEYRD